MYQPLPPSTDPAPSYIDQYHPVLTQYYDVSTSIDWECCLGITDFCTVYPGSSLWYRSILLSNCFLHCHTINQFALNVSGRNYIEGNISEQQEQICTSLPFLAKLVQPLVLHMKWALSWIWWITDSNYRLMLYSDSKLCKTSGNGVRKKLSMPSNIVVWR